MFDLLRNLTKSVKEKQQEALHAYLDDELNSRQKHSFEQQMAQDAGLQEQVRQARVLKQQMRQLPQRRVPRSFMLDPALYGRPEKQPLFQIYPALRVATVLTAFFFVLAIGLDLFTVSSNMQSAAPAPDQDVAMVADELMEEAVKTEAENAAVEVTRVVVQSEPVEVESIVEGEAAAEAAAEAVAEDSAAETPAEEPALAQEETVGQAESETSAEPAADVAAGYAESGEEAVPETALSTSDAGAARAGTPAAAATMPAPTALLAEPLPTATRSEPPRPTDGGGENDRAVAIAPTVGVDQQLTADATALEQFGSSPARQPFSSVRLLQIGLGTLLVILSLATLILRRQRR